MEDNYDYYQIYLTAPLTKVPVKMLTSSNVEPNHYPVTVLDANNATIGTAINKITYVALWNSAPSNVVIGNLTGGTGPFSFVLELKKGQTAPSKVTGDPVDIFEGVFSNTFGLEFN